MIFTHLLLHDDNTHTIFQYVPRIHRCDTQLTHPHFNPFVPQCAKTRWVSDPRVLLPAIRLRPRLHTTPLTNRTWGGLMPSLHGCQGNICAHALTHSLPDLCDLLEIMKLSCVQRRLNFSPCSLTLYLNLCSLTLETGTLVHNAIQKARLPVVYACALSPPDIDQILENKHFHCNKNFDIFILCQLLLKE